MQSPSRQIGERIRALRKQEGLSQEVLAARSQLAPSYYSALERGEKNPTLGTLGRVAAALDVSLAEIVAGDYIKLGRELEEVLRDVPSRVRPAYLRAMREVVLVLHEASSEAARRALGRSGDIKRPMS